MRGKVRAAACVTREKFLQSSMVLENEKFYSSVLTIQVGDKSQAAILKDVQRHPARPFVMHLDFQRIVADQEIRMNVPLHFVGENVAPGVKQSGGKISHLRTDVEVVCLPGNLPEYLELDVSKLELDEYLYLSDIELPEGVAIPELAQEEEGEQQQPVVSCHIIKEVVIEEEVEEVEGEVPVVGEEPEEGEAPAESADEGESTEE